MYFKYLTLFLLILSSSIKAGYIEINDKFPLSKSNTIDAGLSLLGGVAQSVRSEGALVTNPATIATDKFISFKFNFSGTQEFVNFDASSVKELRFNINLISMVIPAGIVGNFYGQYYSNYDNRFYVQDVSSNQNLDIHGTINRAVFGWAKNFYGINVGVNLSKNFGSFYQRSLLAIEDEGAWQPFLNEDVEVYYEEKMFDDLSVGLSRAFGKFDVGVSYSLGDEVKLSNIQRKGSISPSGILMYTSYDSTFYEVEMGQRFAFGASYNSKKTGFNVDFNFQPDDITKYFEVGLGFRKTFTRSGNFPLRIGLNGKIVDLFDDDYYESVLAVGSEYFMEKQRGKFGLSLGAAHRRGNDDVSETKVFMSVGITGFSTWGGVELK